jgi:hypothetical protein
LSDITPDNWNQDWQFMNVALTVTDSGSPEVQDYINIPKGTTVDQLYLMVLKLIVKGKVRVPAPLRSRPHPRFILHFLEGYAVPMLNARFRVTHTWFQGRSWNPLFVMGKFEGRLPNYRRGTGTYQRTWNELEKKLYNLANVVRRYKNDNDIRLAEDLLQLVSQAKRLYPTPQMLRIGGRMRMHLEHPDIKGKPFDANKLMDLVLKDAQRDYHPLYTKYWRLVANDANAAMGTPDNVRSSENIQRERYLRKRALGASYAQSTRKGTGRGTGRGTGASAIQLDQLPRGVARMVASKLGNTNLASFMATSKTARNESGGLLAERLEPYLHFMKLLLEDLMLMTRYAGTLTGRIAPGMKLDGWVTRATGAPGYLDVSKTTARAPLVNMRLQATSHASAVEVRDKASKAMYKLKYTKPENSIEFRWLRGSQTSDFMKRSYEALRQAAATKRLTMRKFEPEEAFDND